MAALLLAIGVLGAAEATGQDGARPPQGKDQPRPAKGKGDAPKADASKPAPVKLGLLINDPKAMQGYTLISPVRFIEDVSSRHAGPSRAFVGDGLWSGTVRFPPR